MTSEVIKNNISRRVNPSYVIILEGILIFHHPRVRDLMNMKIFVDTDADVRLARRIRHDTGEKGRDIGMVLDQYSKFVKPAFDNFILPTKKSADIIIPRGGDNHVAIDLIVQHIRTKLGQHDLCKIYPNLYIRGMHTLIRDAQTTKHDFVFYEDRLIRLRLNHFRFLKEVMVMLEKQLIGHRVDRSICAWFWEQSISLPDSFKVSF
ncbi:hypothetical protein L2E82_38518 [Cichorium intybus]|uniref:Uncharacterized protein n=1 Tax=Cichorium intybus TaxID=13427 RepID=A0ACB9AFL0_CICIN|nr:hypothetical protein L2E82_38518 [Cichorium intybus]